jgi:hypothetical protein
MYSEKSLDVLKVGDRVRIKPEWQDPGDDEFERVVIEAPADCTRVLVQTIIPGFTHHPVARIEVSMLERVKLGLHIDSEGEVNIEDEVIGKKLKKRRILGLVAKNF